MASSDEQQVSSLTPAVCVTDWTLCALCQKNTRERLQCPANNSNKTALGASYKTLAQHLLKFEELGSKMPMSVNMARLDEGGGVENTFLKRSAVFHSSCRLKFNKTELKRRAASVDSKSEKIATAAESVDKKIPSPTPSKLLRRHSDEHDTESEPICFLCAQKAPLAKLRNASTFKLDAKLRHCAAVLQDHNLQAKLSCGDVISQEAKYHPTCLILLYRKAAEIEKSEKKAYHVTSDKNHLMLHGIAFAQLVEYVQEKRLSDDGRKRPDKMTVFRLAELVAFYDDCLASYELIPEAKTNSTRLKLRLLAYFPDMIDFQEGRDVLLGFENQLGNALKTAYTEDFDDECVHLVRAACVVRREIFNITNRFAGSLQVQAYHNHFTHW